MPSTENLLGFKRLFSLVIEQRQTFFKLSKILIVVGSFIKS